MKIRPLISSIKFLSPEVALYLYKSTTPSCMEYCCHIWAGAPSRYFKSLHIISYKKWYTGSGPSLATSLEPLAHCRNLASLKVCVCYICAGLFLSSLNESTCQTRKNVFYFTSKAPFLKIFKSFKILHYQISWCHQIFNHKTRSTFHWITWKVNTVC